jgi:toxin ParE1/3/4
MPRCEFTEKAAEDLSEIGPYTKPAWGNAQARRYREELELALKRLSMSPRIGLERDEVAPQVRSFTVASHIAFYLPRKDGITVLRLLRPSMDIERGFDLHPEKPRERER